MKKSTIAKTKDGYVWIDTCQLNNPISNMMDNMGMGNSDATSFEYETMVFKSDKKGKVLDWNHLDKANYSTEKEAIKGHNKMVKKYNKKP